MATTQDQLKLKIEELTNLQDVSPIPLRGQIILAYRQKVLAGAREIIEKSGDDEQKLYTELQIFLGENWKKYGLSPVGYTALPNDPITEFLCDIAIKIAQNLKNEKLAIGILMPGVQTQATVDSAVYPDLDGLPLKQVIKTHIINRNGRYLLPVKFLRQITASSVETNIYNHYHDGLSEDPDLQNEDLAYLDSEEKHRLFNHSSETRSIIEAKRHFDTLTNDNSNLLSQLNMLILDLRFHSKQGLGSEGAASEGVYILIFNFQQFYDKLTLGQKDIIPPLVRKEIDLLLNVTDKTKERYNEAIAEGDAVAEGSVVPPGPQPTVTTCIDTRQKILTDSMRGHEAILASITLSAETKEELIKEATQALAEAQKILLEKIANPVTYTGVDNLKIPDIHFLHDLVVKFSIAHIEDLTLLSVDDFNVLCSNKNYRSEIVVIFNKDPINAYADLSAFAFLSKPDMLGAVLSQFAKELFITAMRRDPERLSWLLNALNNERFEIACTAMSGYFKEILYAPSYYGDHPEPRVFFSLLKRTLNSERKYFLITKIIDMDRPHSISQSVLLMDDLDLVQKTRIFEIYIKDLLGKLRNIDELKAILFMPKELQAVFIENISPDLFEKFITTELFITVMRIDPERLSFLLNVLNNERFEMVCTAMSGYFKEIFYKVPPYDYDARYIEPKKFFSTLKNTLSTEKQYFLIKKIIDMSRLRSAAQFITLIDGLDLAQKISLFEIHVKDLSRKLRDIDELKAALCDMPKELQAIFIDNLLRDFFSSTIYFDDLKSLQALMPEDLFAKFVAIMVNHLPVAKGIDYLNFLNKEISNELFKKIIAIQIESSSDMLKANDYVQSLLWWFPRIEFRAFILEQIEHGYERSDLIENYINLFMAYAKWSNEPCGQVMDCLKVKQSPEIFQAIKSSILKGTYDYSLSEIAGGITSAQQTELFLALLNSDNGQLRWIRTASNFCNLAEALKGNRDIFQRIATKMIETGKLAKCINYYNDVLSMDQILTSDQMKELERQWMRDFLPMYNARLSFFSDPRSAGWSEKMKRREVNIAEVLYHATLKPSSRTADAVSEMREIRASIKVG